MSDSENNLNNLPNTSNATGDNACEQQQAQQFTGQNQASTSPCQPTPQQAASNPYAQTPTQQPYAANPQAQSPYGAAPQNPYAAPPSPYGQPAAAQPKKKWPWVVLACVLAFLLGLGGCVGCATISLVTDSLHTRSDSIHSYDYDDLYGYDPDDAPDSDLYGGFTLDDIKDAAGNLPNEVSDDNQATAGVYVVGRDIDAGTYFLQGSPSVESQFYLFDPEGSGTFSLKSAVSYTGNYFADLEDGEVVAFMPELDDALMMPTEDATFQPQAPYQSGLYRVGTDIPAGTYDVTVNPTAPHNLSQDFAAYVMQDLDFGDDSITDSVYLLRGSTQTITVQEGDWLELYGTIATPSK